MRVVVIEPPVPVIDLPTALDHLRADSGADDALITDMVAAATGHVEEWTGRAINARVLEARLDGAAERCVRLPVVPVAEITAFRWREGGQWRDGDLSALELDGRDVVPIQAAPWANADHEPGALRITFRAGYPATADEPARPTMPDQIRSAILLMTSFLYHNRGAQTAEPPAAIAILLQPFKVYA